MSHFELLTVCLLGWALFGSALSVVGLYVKPSEFFRGFWFMNGLWCFIDGVIAWVGMLRPVPEDAELADLLLINSALDVGYLIIGFILLTRKKPILKGFGLAILFQGLALLIFDLWLYNRITGNLLQASS